MSTAAASDEVKRLARLQTIRVFFILIFELAILVVASGQLDWPMMWFWFFCFLFIMLMGGSWMSRNRPEVLAARARQEKGAEGWDKLLVPWILILGTPASFVVSGLDQRFSWSNAFPTGISLAALFVGLGGYLLILISMAANPHFEGLVRIQTERDHQVMSGGPYRWVRHPGYVGMTVLFLTGPVIFNSTWALIPVGVSTVLAIIRTALEDRFLQRELGGYSEFSQRTRYRLIPGLW